MSRSVLVFCGGDAPSRSTMAKLGTHDLVVAADSGIDHALAAEISVDIAVGDFDSVSQAGLNKVTNGGAKIVKHRPDKDETDFELALDQAIEAGATSITVVGSEGGRLDHQYANLLAMAHSRLSGCTVRSVTDQHNVTVIHNSVTLEAEPGSLLSLLPVGGAVTGVVTEGLSYPLEGETLPAASCRGISNTFSDPVATITITSGVLLAFAVNEAPEITETGR